MMQANVCSHPNFLLYFLVIILNSAMLGEQIIRPLVSRSSQSSICFAQRHIVGSEPLDLLAQHIWRSIGPSGPNKVCVIR
jgi:hypothetical protein